MLCVFYTYTKLIQVFIEKVHHTRLDRSQTRLDRSGSVRIQAFTIHIHIHIHIQIAFDLDRSQINSRFTLRKYITLVLIDLTSHSNVHIQIAFDLD